MDPLPFFDTFPHKPMIYNIGWETSLYAVGAMVFLYTEPFLKHLVKGAGLYVSHRQAWHELTLPRTWATMIWMVVLLLVFVTMQEVSRVLGEGQLKIHVFGPQAHSGSTPAQGRLKASEPRPSEPEGVVGGPTLNRTCT